MDLGGEDQAPRRGWKLGAEDFRDRLADELSEKDKKGEPARGRREFDHVLAEGLAQDCLREVGWSMRVLEQNPKGDVIKVEIARQLRAQTPLTRRWIAQRLRMGSPGYLSQLLGRT